MAKEGLFDKAEFHAGIAGGAAILGVWSTPYVTSALAKYGNTAVTLGELAIGAGSLILGAFIKHDGASSALIGFGVSYFVEGILRVIIPNTSLFHSAAVLSSNVGTGSSTVGTTSAWF